MTKKEQIEERDKTIASLKRETLRLNGNLTLLSMEYKRQIKNLLGCIHKLRKSLEDPLLILPNGETLQFSSLNAEQLEYLQSLATKQKRV